VNGHFFYNSLTTTNGFTASVFPSTDGGATWGAPVFAYGGDKQWMTIDRTGGAANGDIYEAWSTASNPYAPNTFTRSLDQGQTYQPPSAIPSPPIWGTLDVAPDGTVYVAGSSGPNSTIRVARSLNAGQPGTPTFTIVGVNLGGTVQTGGPNPLGLLGQAWVAVDPSPARSGWVYLLCSVRTPTDPMDVMFSGARTTARPGARRCGSTTTRLARAPSNGSARCPSRRTDGSTRCGTTRAGRPTAR
jgi:hypothetical protein